MPLSSRAKRARTFTVAAALALASGAAQAADPAPRRAPAPAAPAPAPSTTFYDFTFGVRLTSDYNFRGISQSDREFGPQAYAELQLWDNLLYAGITGNRVKLPTDPAAEIDLTAGIRPKFGPLTFDFGVIHYYYPHEEQL